MFASLRGLDIAAHMLRNRDTAAQRHTWRVVVLRALWFAGDCCRVCHVLSCSATFFAQCARFKPYACPQPHCPFRLPHTPVHPCLANMAQRGDDAEWWGADSWWAEGWRGVASSTWASAGGAYTAPEETWWWQTPWAATAGWGPRELEPGPLPVPAGPSRSGKGGSKGRRAAGGAEKGGKRAGEALPPVTVPQAPRGKGGVVPDSWEPGAWRPWFGEGEVLKTYWPGSVKHTFGPAGTDHSWEALQALADEHEWSIALRSRERGSRRVGTFRVIHVLIIVAPVRLTRMIYGICVSYSRKSGAAQGLCKYPAYHHTFVHRIRNMKMEWRTQEHSDDESDVDPAAPPDEQQHSRVLSVDQQLQVASGGPGLRAGGRERADVGEEFPPADDQDDDARSSSSVAESEEQPQSDVEAAAARPDRATPAAVAVSGAAPSTATATLATATPPGRETASQSSREAASARPTSATATTVPGQPVAQTATSQEPAAASAWGPRQRLGPASAYWTPEVARMYFAARKRLEAGMSNSPSPSGCPSFWCCSSGGSSV